MLKQLVKRKWDIGRK